jgi:Protein of unknown function (DUF4038)/Putative collagen-binding domain of a collagenase
MRIVRTIAFFISPGWSLLSVAVIVGGCSSHGSAIASGGTATDSGGSNVVATSGAGPENIAGASVGGVPAAAGAPAGGNGGASDIAGSSGSGGGLTTAGAAGGGGVGTGGVSAADRLRPASNGRYLEWSNGTPIFLLSDTAWLLPARYTLAEVTEHAATRAAQGFTAIQVTASFPENGYQSLASVFTAGDFSRPLESYWSSLDAKVEAITGAGLILILNPLWRKTSEATLTSNGPDRCRAYGKWLGARYRSNQRVAYFLGGDATPDPARTELDAMGLGIQDAYAEAGLPAAIIAYHGAPARSSREEWPTTPSWLTLDWTYAYSLPLGAPVPYQENWTDFPKSPAMPIMFGEGWYDRDNGATNASRFGNRFMVRRQLWWNPLSGALAGCAYGAEPIWFHGYGGYTPAQAALWNSGLDAGRMKSFLYTLEWWRLRPDSEHAFITAGNSNPGDVDYAVGALADDDSFGVVYTPTARNLTLKMPIGKAYVLRWFDPTNATYRPESVAGASGASIVMAHPGKNSSNTDDWVIYVGR